MKTTEQLIEEIKKRFYTKNIDRTMSSFLSDCIKVSYWNLLNTKMKGKEVWNTVKEGGSVPFGNRDEKGELSLKSINKALNLMKKNNPSEYAVFQCEDWSEDFCKEFFRLAVLDPQKSEKLKERLQPLVDEVVAGLTEDALDYLDEQGYNILISYGQLCKLFKEPFGFNRQFPNTGEYGGLCLIYSKKKKEVQLYYYPLQATVWGAKCDMQNVQSIKDAAIECLNNCMKLDNVDW